MEKLQEFQKRKSVFYSQNPEVPHCPSRIERSKPLTRPSLLMSANTRSFPRLVRLHYFRFHLRLHWESVDGERKATCCASQFPLVPQLASSCARSAPSTIPSPFMSREPRTGVQVNLISPVVAVPPTLVSLTRYWRPLSAVKVTREAFAVPH